MIDPALQLVVRVAGALLLVSAASHKLRDREGFRAALAGYRLLPESFAGLIVTAEIAIGIGLLATPRAGVAAAALLALYAGAIGVNLARGRREIDCGCAGSPRALSGWLVARNLVLVAAFAACAFPTDERALGAIDALSVGGGIVSLALLYAALDVAIANGGRRWATR